MRWEMYWWGATLIAETDEDEKLLRLLDEKLPEKPERDYDSGGRVLERNEKGKRELELVFHR